MSSRFIWIPMSWVYGKYIYFYIVDPHAESVSLVRELFLSTYILTPLPVHTPMRHISLLIVNPSQSIVHTLLRNVSLLTVHPSQSIRTSASVTWRRILISTMSAFSVQGHSFTYIYGKLNGRVKQHSYRSIYVKYNIRHAWYDVRYLVFHLDNMPCWWPWHPEMIASLSAPCYSGTSCLELPVWADHYVSQSVNRIKTLYTSLWRPLNMDITQIIVKKLCPILLWRYLLSRASNVDLIYQS